MAKSTKSKPPKNNPPATGGTPPPTFDLTNWYSSLTYFPSDYKSSKLWCAQMLWFAKNNCQVLADEKKLNEYRRTDILEIDEGKLKLLIDPATPKSPGGEARYFTSDMKMMPIATHLDNIIEEEILGIAANIVCKIADPIVKLREQKDRQKIIYQGMVRNIINDFAKELGIPGIQNIENPYKWIKKFTAAKEDQDTIDTVGGAISQIQTKIKDDDTMRLWQNFLYKNGLELAFEVGIKYFMLEQNEFDIKYSVDFCRDLKHVNRVSGRAAVDEMTGEMTIRYYDPSKLFTSPFKDKNGDDILYYFYEENLNWADFERLVGADMTYEEKKKAVELQKQQGWNWGAVPNSSNNTNAMVRVGFFAVLTQESQNFAVRYINDRTPLMVHKEETWTPDAANEEREVRAYNVWQTCYYMPINIQEFNRNDAIAWQEQAKYIFHITKEVDMMRYGKDGRYTKSPLVIWKDDTRPSWTDIKQAYMPKINLLWQDYQNCIVNDIDAIAMSNELILGMVKAVDESNSKDDGGNAQVESWKQLKQAGQTFFNFTDRNGNQIVDPSKMFVAVKNGLLAKSKEILMSIMELYNLMTQSLAKGQAGEGVQPKARTATAGIEIASENANKATAYLKKSYSNGVIIPFAMRFAQHIHTVVKEKTKYNYAERWKIFNDVIGRYNGAVLEGIEKINFENIGLTIANKDDSAKREAVFKLIFEKYAQKDVTTAGLALAIGTDNYKLQLVELALEEQKQDEKKQKQLEAERQHEMDMKKIDLQIAQALTAAKGQAKDKNIQTQGQTDAAVQAQMNKLKSDTMQQQKAQLLQNKLQEIEKKGEVAKDQKSHQAELDLQKSLVS